MDKKEEKRKIMEKWKNLGLLDTENSIEPIKYDLPQFDVLPLAKRVAMSTIGMDLVSVKPMSMPNSSPDNTETINEVKVINRERKINSIVNGGEYTPMKIEDHPNYKKSTGLFFIDIIY